MVVPMLVRAARHQFWIDRGGTFTDCVHHDIDNGTLRVIKVLSSDEAPWLAIRRLLDLSAGSSIPSCEVRMGTTLATNALLERQGSPTVLIATTGLGDLIHIGDQTRPDLFALHIERPAPLPSEVIEVSERTMADGSVRGELAEEELLAALGSAQGKGAKSLAIALVHAYRDPSLEQRVAALGRGLGFEHVSTSHTVSHELGLLSRTDTTVANAYLTPLLTRYAQRLKDELEGSELRMMQSNGGLVDIDHFIGRDAVLSGPAAGVVAAASVAEDLGLGKVIGFDMGGTSTDVSRYAGRFSRVFESRVGGIRIRAPMIELHTVAAGGGSICQLDGKRLTVGPHSAGADPGPLCYGRPDATDLALTDVSLFLGRIAADRFPFDLDSSAPRRSLEAISLNLRNLGLTRSPTEVAEGFLRVAVDNMAAAIRKVSVGRGHDVRDHAMVVFGGAGGQYACMVARRLGIRTLILHPYAGVLSAFGMGVASFEWRGERDAGREALEEADPDQWWAIFEELEAVGRDTLSKDAGPHARWTVERQLALRYRGTETSLLIDFAETTEMLDAFESAHRREFGYARPDHIVEVASLWVAVGLQGDKPELPRVQGGEGKPVRRASLWSAGKVREAPVYHREDLPVGSEILGPALVLDDTGTVVIEEGFAAERDERDYLILHDRAPEIGDQPGSTAVDPVLLEVFNNQFRSIAEQMGVVLQRTAMSTNIRDRMDFSCAVFDPHGGLVANAPHIPVHLGAMSESVQAVLAEHSSPNPGDVYLTNDPGGGGSHLPDITVITPLHDEAGGLRFVLASRGHHADVGGITPGSMPPFSTRLEEEGVVFRNVVAVRAGVFQENALRRTLEAGPYPARNPRENLADLQAQIAANEKGVRLLRELLDRYGLQVVSAYMQHIQDNAAELTTKAIEALADGEHEFTDRLDDGTKISVRMTVRGGRMEIDFAGTDEALDSNLNAPRAVTVAAVLYVLRLIVAKPIPLNSGCLRPVEILIPERSVLSPEPWRAVAAGNVETSQRVVDVLLGALGLAGASQGTMNNVTFGSEHLAYYETLGGGSGATENYDGASAVHTHMTNSRCTDPEVLETRFPIVVKRFSLRPGSGGRGKKTGGDGLVRELEFLAPMRVSVISERRSLAPYGMRGGGAGAAGVNQLNDSKLAHRVTVDVLPGDVLRLETPGGGAWGERE